MQNDKFKRTRFACYAAYFTMSSVFSLPPLLFMTFREQYGISYTLLGTLVLVNFCTQLAIDLVFTFFTKYFNVPKVVRIMPLITAFGLLCYALIPTLCPDFAYGGLLIGTVLFSVSAGLSECLLSPTIAAMPSDNPQRDMSFLHSLYAFGVFTVVVVSTIFLKLFGSENWMILTIFWAVLPVIPSVLFFLSPMPNMDVTESEGGSSTAASHRTVGLVLCLACIFFGSCSENVMSNWISTYMENALHIDKAIGDILGMAVFAILLGLTRMGYAKFGKNISRMLLFGMAGAAVCYLTAGLAQGTIVAFVACILTGICTSMLWPGTLILMEEKLPGAGVTAYAMMAAGGDFGASVAPQLMGIVVDKVSTSATGIELASTLGMTVEQVGMKAGMLVTAIFPILGVIVVLLAMRYFGKNKVKQ